MAVATACAAGAACDEPPPRVVIRAPAPGAAIAEHDAIRLEVEVATAEPLRDLTASVDGRPAPAIVSPAPAHARCDRGCTFVVFVESERLAEGLRRVGVTARDARGRASSAERAVTLVDTPRLSLRVPGDDDVVGRGHVEIIADVLDRSQVTATVTVDGAPLDARVTGACATGCEVRAPWDVAAATPGARVVEVTVADPDGRTASLRRPVDAGDGVFVRAIEVTGERDFRNLELELHVLDAATGALFGCAGRGTGLEHVDRSDVRQVVMAPLRTPAGQVLSTAELEGERVVIVVIEDDSGACPAPPGRRDDVIGRSAPVRGEAISGTRAFDDVVFVELITGRPL